MNYFHNFFTYEDSMSYYSFFYFRTSPRGNSKLGLSDVPWQRLRVQQQGTDEPIQFDHLWILQAKTKLDVVSFEKELKRQFANICIFKDTNRAGHTEWFAELDYKKFKVHFDKLAKLHGINSIKTHNPKKPYIATRKSVCPLQMDVRASQSWSDTFWKKNSTIKPS
jgi:hypothetical protein